MSDKLDMSLLGDGPSFMPKAAIVQSGSKSKRTESDLGSIFIDKGTEYHKNLHLVPLDFKFGRQWFAGRGTKIFCRSDDGSKPIESKSDNYQRQANYCSQCPKSRWGGKYSPPSCSEFLEITFANLTPGSSSEVIQMSFQKTAIKDAKMMLKAMSDNGGASHNSVRIDTQEMFSKDGSFSWFIPLFLDIKPLTDGEEGIVAPLRDQYTTKPVEEKQVEEEHAASFTPELMEVELED